MKLEALAGLGMFLGMLLHFPILGLKEDLV